MSRFPFLADLIIWTISWPFDDFLIKNGESNRICNIVTNIFRPYRFEYDHKLLRFPFSAVFGTLFSIDNWWRHKNCMTTVWLIKKNNQKRNFRFKSFYWDRERFSSIWTVHFMAIFIILSVLSKISLCLWYP